MLRISASFLAAYLARQALEVSNQGPEGFTRVL